VHVGIKALGDSLAELLHELLLLQNIKKRSENIKKWSENSKEDRKIWTSKCECGIGINMIQGEKCRNFPNSPQLLFVSCPVFFLSAIFLSLMMTKLKFLHAFVGRLLPAERCCRPILR
jgi:hypothetical protein